ncbi:MAG TPA: TetR family transcriptional regulator [Candidatus Sulfotelmatobacter sp.]|nr:TetR family transcriptional regulator [Candidatus Sulfotelmatobacter sp.]
MPIVRETPPKGRRELNRQDKLRRIKAAARKLFIAHGYDEASTREIAVRAGVALGTLFLYAADKRDLLFLVVNDDFERVTAEAADAVRPAASFLDNLLAALRPLYAFFDREPRLARLALREMMFYEAGDQARRFVKTRERMIALCGTIVRMAQDKREIRTKEDPHKVAALLFAIFQIEVRRWLTPPLADVEVGLRDLQRAFEVMMTGLSPTPRAFETSE